MTTAPISADYARYIAGALPGLSDGLVECMASTSPEVSVRFNSLKTSPEAEAAIVGELVGPELAAGVGRVAWCEGGVYLPRRPDFTHDPALHQGLYYVQDASSMIAARIAAFIGRREGGVPLLYLDACAAPGGKTTAAVDALPCGSFVVANEYDFRRAEILRENILKWGRADVAVCRGDASRFGRLEAMFDVVAVDAPCSGEGMMRKDEQARLQWSPGLVAECAARQLQIVDNLWPAIAPGGYLVYSTCTFNPEENERVVERIVSRYGAVPVSVPLDAGWGVVVDGNGFMRFLPNKVRGEGLFVAVLQKPGVRVGALNSAFNALPDRRGKSSKPRKGGAGRSDALSSDVVRRLCSSWLEGDFDFSVADDAVYAVRSHRVGLVCELQRCLDVILPGIEVGIVKGGGIVPSQGLALSELLRRGAFPSVAVDKAMALAYLRRESLPGFSLPKGIVLLEYGCCDATLRPLGFVNNLGNRANNLYPQNWKIRQ